MKKKEVLVVFVLALLVTAGSWFVRIPIFVGWLGTWYFRGLPLSYWSDRWGFSLPSWRKFLGRYLGESFIAGLSPTYLIIDLLFWFLVIFGIWQVVKWIKGKYGRGN